MVKLHLGFYLAWGDQKANLKFACKTKLVFCRQPASAKYPFGLVWAIWKTKLKLAFSEKPLCHNVPSHKTVFCLLRFWCNVL